MTAKHIVCFGELLLRLGAPGRERLLQSPRLDVHVGGAEANVAVALAHFGHRVSLVSVVPDNALGAAAVSEMRRSGVDTGHVARTSGRMGLYFLEIGALQRPSDVLYDRAGSAFALAAPDSVDWGLLDGVDALHISGVTPAVSAHAAEAAVRAAQAARTRGLFVTFDGNFRAKLWQAWRSDPGAILKQLFASADLVFADCRDIGMVLGREFTGPPFADDSAAAAAFDAFPQLARIAMTVRTQHSVDHHELGARLYTRTERIESDAWPIVPIVDRIGSGDAFAAGMLHGLFNGMNDAAALQFALAAACLKHSIPGDALHMSAAEVASLIGANTFNIRR